MNEYFQKYNAVNEQSFINNSLQLQLSPAFRKPSVQPDYRHTRPRLQEISGMANFAQKMATSSSSSSSSELVSDSSISVTSPSYPKYSAVPIETLQDDSELNQLKAENLQLKTLIMKVRKDSNQRLKQMEFDLIESHSKEVSKLTSKIAELQLKHSAEVASLNEDAATMMVLVSQRKGLLSSSNPCQSTHIEIKSLSEKVGKLEKLLSVEREEMSEVSLQLSLVIQANNKLETLHERSQKMLQNLIFIHEESQQRIELLASDLEKSTTNLTEVKHSLQLSQAELSITKKSEASLKHQLSSFEQAAELQHKNFIQPCTERAPIKPAEVNVLSNLLAKIKQEINQSTPAVVYESHLLSFSNFIDKKEATVDGVSARMSVSPALDNSQGSCGSSSSSSLNLHYNKRLRALRDSSNTVVDTQKPRSSSSSSLTPIPLSASPTFSHQQQNSSSSPISKVPQPSTLHRLRSISSNNSSFHDHTSSNSLQRVQNVLPFYPVLEQNTSRSNALFQTSTEVKQVIGQPSKSTAQVSPHWALKQPLPSQSIASFIQIKAVSTQHSNATSSKSPKKSSVSDMLTFDQSDKENVAKNYQTPFQAAATKRNRVGDR